MAHAHTELVLGPGVNALTGPNNTGKSAIVEGLRCIATNPIPRHYIRHGAKEARVSLEFEDGTRVVWVRKKRSAGYELWRPGAEKPEEYWKFGRRPPEDILDVLKLDLVELETGGEMDVHVGNQREPVFLLNQPGSNAAAFFAASTESAHLLAMQNRLKQRSLEAKRQEKSLLGRMAEVETEMDRFAPLPELYLGLNVAQELESTANTLQLEIPQLQQVIKMQAALCRQHRFRQATLAVLATLKPAPKSVDTRPLLNCMTQIKEVGRALSASNKVGNVLSLLRPVPEVFDTTGLATVCARLHALEVGLVKGRAKERISGTLHVPPVLTECGNLAESIREMGLLDRRERREERRLAVLRAVAEPPGIDPPTNLESFLRTMRQLVAEKQEAEQNLKQVEEQLRQTREVIRQRIETIGFCPTCGHKITGDDFLERGCGHGA